MKKEKKKIEKPVKIVTISKETARRNIVEWLYVNDGGYPNKLKWREAFVLMLEWNIKRIK